MMTVRQLLTSCDIRPSACAIASSRSAMIRTPMPVDDWVTSLKRTSMAAGRQSGPTGSAATTYQRSGTV